MNIPLSSFSVPLFPDLIPDERSGRTDFFLHFSYSTPEERRIPEGAPPSLALLPAFKVAPVGDLQSNSPAAPTGAEHLMIIGIL